MYRKITLDNGLRLITSRMPHTRSVSVVFLLGVGGCYETEDEAGISHFIEHLCFKGTEKRRTAKEISGAIEGTGGVINGGTDKELTVFWCKVASQHFFLALDVLVDLIRNSRFDVKDIGRERQIIIEEINMSLDSPRQRVDTIIDELLWPGRPLGRDVAGRKESVASLTQQQMLDYFYRHYLPNNTVVSIAGDIEQEQVQDVVSNALGDWKPNNVASRYPSDGEQEAPRLRIEVRDTEQVHLSLGVPGLSLFHLDRFAVDLLNVVLGEGMSSRLFIEIRENQGLAYEIHSCVDHFTDSGSVVVLAGVDSRRVDDAIMAILNQLSQLKDNVTDSELTRAKELAKGRLLLSLENSQSVANWLGAQEMLTGRILSIDEVMRFVEAVTTEDVKRVARQLLVGDKLNLAIVGPARDEEHLFKLLKL